MASVAQVILRLRTISVQAIEAAKVRFFQAKHKRQGASTSEELPDVFSLLFFFFLNRPDAITAVSAPQIHT